MNVCGFRTNTVNFLKNGCREDSEEVPSALILSNVQHRVTPLSAKGSLIVKSVGR